MPEGSQEAIIGHLGHPECTLWRVVIKDVILPVYDPEYGGFHGYPNTGLATTTESGHDHRWASCRHPDDGCGKVQNQPVHILGPPPNPPLDRVSDMGYLGPGYAQKVLILSVFRTAISEVSRMGVSGSKNE